MLPFRPCGDTPDYLVDGLTKQTKADQKRTAALNVINAKKEISSGRIKVARANELGMEFKRYGAGVLEDESGRVWWLEGDEIVRKDDEYIHKMIEGLYENAENRG